jgi:protein involved in polysaccharide export with SLBB domain
MTLCKIDPLIDRRCRHLAVAVLAVLAVASHGSAAQTVAVGQGRGGFETRSDLEGELAAAEAKHAVADAFLIRYRLEQGDFQEGDRVVVAVRGPVGFSDTLTVRSGKVLELPQMGSFSLGGILRSELGPKLTAHIGRYLRDPSVSVTPLVRLSIMGYVARPGFYYVAADVPLSDLLMVAGGPTPVADISTMEVRRGSEVIIDRDGTQAALSKGFSVDRMHLRAGDEISVGTEKHVNWTVILSSVTAVVGLLLAAAHR